MNYDGGIRGDYPLPQLVSESAKCRVERHLQHRYESRAGAEGRVGISGIDLFGFGLRLGVLCAVRAFLIDDV